MSSFEDQKAQLRTLQAYKQVFSSPEGKIVLRDLKEHTGFFHQSHSRAESLEQQAALRNLMIYIMGCIGFDTVRLEHEIDTEDDFDTLSIAPDEGMDSD